MTTPLRLRPLVLRLQREPGALRPQVLAALARHGRPLRWAITAVEPACADDGSHDVVLTVEAVVGDPAPVGEP